MTASIGQPNIPQAAKDALLARDVYLGTLCDAAAASATSGAPVATIEAQMVLLDAQATVVGALVGGTAAAAAITAIITAVRAANVAPDLTASLLPIRTANADRFNPRLIA